MKPLSQKLAELSVQTKTTEERVAKVQNEGREYFDRRREQVRQEVEQALGEVQQRFQQAQGETRTRLEALHAKVNCDFEQMKKDVGEKKRKFEAWQAENYASDKETAALAAIDYALAAAKIAELQTLDAIAARAETDSRSEQFQHTPTLA